MQRRQRHLARAHEVQVVVGEAVDLLLGVGQEAGAVERLLAHEHGRDHRLEAVAAQHLERPADERQLEQHEVALEVGEARARDARAPPPCRSTRPRGRGGRAACSIRRGSPTSRSVSSASAAVGSGGLGSEASAASSAASTAASSSRQRLDAARDLLHLGDRGGGVLARLLGLRDPLRGLVLARAQRPRPPAAAHAGARRAPAPRRAARPSRRRAAPAPPVPPRGPGGSPSGRARAAPQPAPAGCRPPACPSSSRRSARPPRPPCRPRCSAASGRRRSRRCGSRRGPASYVLLALVEVRAVLVLALVGVDRRSPGRPSTSSEWQPRAALRGRSPRRRTPGSFSATSMLLRPQATSGGGDEREARGAAGGGA